MLNGNIPEKNNVEEVELTEDPNAPTRFTALNRVLVRDHGRFHGKVIKKIIEAHVMRFLIDYLFLEIVDEKIYFLCSSSTIMCNYLCLNE